MFTFFDMYPLARFRPSMDRHLCLKLLAYAFLFLLPILLLPLFSETLQPEDSWGLGFSIFSFPTRGAVIDALARQGNRTSLSISSPNTTDLKLWTLVAYDKFLPSSQSLSNGNVSDALFFAIGQGSALTLSAITAREYWSARCGFPMRLLNLPITANYIFAKDLSAAETIHEGNICTEFNLDIATLGLCGAYQKRRL